jgi:putative ABC transport system permease protein
MNRLGRDVRLALRGFRRTPTFVAAVLAILGLGIGMAVAMFTAFQTILVRRLPVADQDRVAVLWTYRTPGVELSALATDLPAIRRASRTMRDIAGVVHWGTYATPMLDGDQTRVISRSFVTPNFFAVLGARPVIGRLLNESDEVDDCPCSMVLSYSVWKSEFAGSSAVLGRQLRDPYLGGTYTIIGVAPAGLDYPLGVGSWTQIARPWADDVLAVARLAPGSTVDAARGELFSIVDKLRPGLKLTGAVGQTLTTVVLGDVRPIFVALLSAVALLLLIACVNVGNLFLVRAASRTRELAIRRAIGASYADLVRQLLVESSLLALAGGALGVLCAQALLRGLVALAPPQLPRLDTVRLHGSLLGVAVAVTVLSVLLFGVLPALVAARVNLASPLRADSRSGTESRRRRRTRDSLVGFQVALALVMLAGAGLLTQSLRRLEQLDLGYRAEHLSIVGLAWDAHRYDTPAKMVEWGERVARQLRAVPGVTGVAPIVVPPFVGQNIWLARIEAEGTTAAAVNPVMEVPAEITDADYFRTFRTPVLEGRSFLDTDREGAQFVALVSQSVARRFWPGQNPIGKHIRYTVATHAPGVVLPNGLLNWRTVVGVVPDTRFRTLRETSPGVYLPWRQFWGWQGTFAVRSSGDIAGLATTMRAAVRQADPTLTLWHIRSMDDMLGAPLSGPRLGAVLLVAFAAVALVLAAVGLYGVMASTVRDQTREIGIRIALGATPSRIRDTVLRRAMIVAGVGATVGLAIALASTHLLRSLLFEVSPTDPVTLAAVSVILLAVALFAAYLPARRATRVDPVQALRAE